MTTIRKGPRLPFTQNPIDPIRFNTIDWFDDDFTNPFDKNDAEKPYYNREHNKEYTIFTFGVTEEGHSVCTRIIQYRPYFYVMVPAEFNETQVANFISAFDAGNTNKIGEGDDSGFVSDITKFYSKYYKSAIVQEECRLYEREIFWKFMNRAKFKFLRLTFISKAAMNFYYRALLKPIDLNIDGRYHLPYKYNLFEADMEPVLRFYHDRDIKPSGWLECAPGTYTIEHNQSKCQINIGCKWDRIMPLELDLIAPLRIASFDIEADSSHGDFPIARKDCKKLANQLVIAWLRDLYILEKEEPASHKYIEATSRLEQKAQFFGDRIKKAMMLTKFAHVDADIDFIYLKGCYATGFEERMKSKCYQTAFAELCQDIYNICNRELKKVKADKLLKSAMKYVEFKELDHIKLYGDINIDGLITICKQAATKFKLDNPDDLINKMVAKDTMVRFVNDKLNTYFGKAYGDRVIQIGTVFWEYGDPNCFHNNIITLKNADSFNVGDEPCEIISFDYKADEMAEMVESKVLVAWTELIEKYDPDIIVGYNIHGFDMSFMFDRALEIIARYEHPVLRKEDKYKLQGHERLQKFLNIGRLHPEIIARCESARGGLVNKKLSSSALGDNFLFYFNTPGRVQIDLLKVAQSSMTKLPSYKLDDVASFYISGKIKKFYPDPDYPSGNQSRIIKVTNIAEIDNGNFVIISMANTGQQLYDGEKIAIRDIDREHDCITLDKSIPTDCMSGGPLWGLAKDDVSAKDIFRLQKGTNQDRATIAKYCIQDCVLLIRLLRKLDVIPNNVGMSNVCLIPFSYIFLRGQGIKIFSLVVNETAKNGYVLPTLEKILPEEEDVDETTRRNNTRVLTGGDTNPAGDEDVGDDTPNTNLAGDEDSGDVFQLKSDFNVIKVTEDGYEGAIVLTPRPNIYFEPITVLDFASLYPSEMIASDLSHDRIVEDDCWLGDEGIKRLDMLGYDVLDRSYDNYSWVDPKNKNKGKYKNGAVTIRYVQTRDGSKGLIPRILQKLLTARKKKKKEMEAATDPFKKTILEGLQMAYKLTANSLYGQIGAQTSKIYKKAIAASTTAGGRINIYKARDFVLKNNPGCEVVYGDSIPGDEPLIYKLNNLETININTVEEVSDLFNWVPYEGFRPNDASIHSKDQACPESMKIYVHDTWVNVRRIIRHKTSKKIYRVNTHCGVVDVTEDHSLINDMGQMIKPTECIINETCVKESYPTHRINNVNIPKSLVEFLKLIYTDGDEIQVQLSIQEKEAFIFGIFFGDGSCGKYNSKWGVKYSWAINNQDMTLLQKVKQFAEDVYGPNVVFKILDTMESSSVYKLVPTGSIKKYVELYSCCYNKYRYKQVPQKFLNASDNIIEYFLAGYYSADGYKCFNTPVKNIRFSNKGKIGTSQLVYLFKKIGYQVSINTRTDKPDVYDVKACIGSGKSALRYPSNIIKKLYHLRNTNVDEYVYDLETEVGNFTAGIGGITLKNTDSVFVKLNLVFPDGTYPEGREDKIQRSIDIGLKLQQQLKDEGVFRKPHDLEYEKVFYPLILITKKRYIGIKYEFDPKEGKKTSMGVVTKRRDNAPILKHTFNGVVDTLTQDCNLTKAIKFVQDTCKQMVDGVYDLNMFVISKTLREYYKDPESIAHKVLAMRMGERDPGTKPTSNERIPYVYIKIEEKPGVEYLQGDRIEHINYVRENKCQVDHQVYIMNQLMKPISQIFELVVELIPGFAYARDPAYFINLENHYYNKFEGDLKKTAKKISDIKKEHVQRLVFQPLIDYAERKVSKRATLDKWLAAPPIKQILPAPELEKIANPDDPFANIDLTIPSQLPNPMHTVNDIDISSAVSQPKEKVKATIKKTKQCSLDSFFGVKN